jgi:hypothetical protein
MKNSFQTLESSLQDSLEGFLWDQWVAIGLGGVARYGYVPFVIDPEALLLATTQFAGHDARFMESVIDWVDGHGQHLSVQRLKNLPSNPGIGSIPVMMEMVKIVSQSRQKHWKTLLTMADVSAQSTDVPAFAKGIALRGMSYAPDPNDSESFLFRMRAVFGVNTRAEVLTWLLTHASGHPANIARETGWYVKSVQTILNDLESSGLVAAHRTDREKVFQLDRAKWLHLLQPNGELHWFTQPPFYLACHYLGETLRSLANASDSSERMLAILVREHLSSTQSALILAGRGDWFSGLQQFSGESLVSRFVETVQKICQVLREDRGRLISP